MLGALYTLFHLISRSCEFYPVLKMKKAGSLPTPDGGLELIYVLLGFQARVWHADTKVLQKKVALGMESGLGIKRALSLKLPQAGFEIKLT